MSYEYKVLQWDTTSNAKNFEDTLNKLGADGWKVVSSGGAGGEGNGSWFKDCWIILMKD